jgi:rhomboid protease GluP
MSQPRAVYVLLAINVVMFLLTEFLTFRYQRATGVSFDDAFSQVLYLLGAKYGPAIDAGQYWRFLTPMVLHGGWIHLGFNCYALYVLGPGTERIFGTKRFLAIYLMAGFAGSIASYFHSAGLSIGASGAIFGLIGALAAFYYSVRSFIGAEASRQQVTQLVSMAAINLVIGFSIPAIDNSAHIGGLITGALAGFVLAPRFRIDDRLYPPVVVRSDRTAVAWALAGGLLALLILLAAASVVVVTQVWKR